MTAPNGQPIAGTGRTTYEVAFDLKPAAPKWPPVHVCPPFESAIEYVFVALLMMSRLAASVPSAPGAFGLATLIELTDAGAERLRGRWPLGPHPHKGPVAVQRDQCVHRS